MERGVRRRRRREGRCRRRQRERRPHQVHPRNGHKTYHMLMRWRTPWHAPHSNSSLYTARIADSSSLFIIALARWWHTIARFVPCFLASLEEITKRRIKWKCLSAIVWYQITSRTTNWKLRGRFMSFPAISEKNENSVRVFSYDRSLRLLEIAVKIEIEVKSVLWKIRFQIGRNHPDRLIQWHVEKANVTF